MIPFFDLASQRATVQRQIDDSIARVLQHGKYILGPEVSELEELLCEYTGAKYCITCANGTDALQIALMGIGIGPGDEVIVPAFSYIATAEAVKLLRAKPVYVDVDPLTFNIDPELIDEKVSSKTKAIIPVSLYGQVANFKKINEIAEKCGLIVIEDAAQSFGAELNGKKSCNLSNIGCTSFFPTKPLGCYGDGGAIFTSDADLAREMRKIARHGQSSRYHHEILGINSRLDTIQAAILKVKLEILNEEIAKREYVARRYTEVLDLVSYVDTPLIEGNNVSSWAQYTIKAKMRNQLQKYASEKGIPTFVHYPLPLNEQPATFDGSANVPHSKALSQEVLSLPINAYMSEENVNFITETISSF